MFFRFYKLREQPFGVTPDPRYLYLSATHREALASLLHGLQCGRGFMTLIAQPGMGKTTLLYYLLEHLRDTARTAFLFQTQTSSLDLLRQLLADLGVGADLHDMVAIHQQLNQLLVSEARSGRQVVVVIDEAQNLSDEVLESVRLLSNFEVPGAKLMQIILAGQPPLADKLARPSLSQLCQRVSIVAHLKPFDLADTNRYLDHRLQVAGHKGKDLFTPQARTFIAMWSDGIPRLINHLCFNAMSIGCALHKEIINTSIVQEAAADLNVAALGSEALWTNGRYPDPGRLAAESVSPPQPTPGGADPHAASDVLPGKASPVRRNGGEGWALRTARYCVLFAFIGLASSTAASLAFERLQIAIQESIAGVEESAQRRPSTSQDKPKKSYATLLARWLGTAVSHVVVEPHNPPNLSAPPAPVHLADSLPAPATKPLMADFSVEESLSSLWTNPTAALVSKASESFGQTPIEALLSAGADAYRTELPGYPPNDNAVDSRPGAIVNGAPIFAANQGTLDIRTLPPEAEISVDGVTRGSTPGRLQIMAGHHRLEIRLPGYRTMHETIKARPGRKLQVYRIMSRL